MFVPMDNVRDSDLILAQNEFAYVLDTNNGRVKCSCRTNKRNPHNNRSTYALC